jgi:two-component system LytT family response regulator
MSSIQQDVTLNQEGESVHTITAVVVDDEELARRILNEHLSEHPDVEVVGECGNGFDAVKAVVELKPDLVFLDIQMPKLDGFEVLELIDRDVAVIFVTAYDEFALRAFEVHAVDYLLKPFSAERLTEALARARQRIGTGNPAALDDIISASRRRHRPLERILVRDGSRVHVLPAESIDYVEAQDDYVCFKCGGKDYLKQQAMNQLEELLDPACFIRIHRSYILNIERLASLELYAKDSRLAVLTDGTRLPVSRAGYTRLKPLL